MHIMLSDPIKLLKGKNHWYVRAWMILRDLELGSHSRVRLKFIYHAQFILCYHFAQIRVLRL